MSRPLNRIFAALPFAAVLLAGCAARIGDTPYEPQVMKQPAPGLAWLEDPVIERDWPAARAHRERLRTLVQRGRTPGEYPMAKAQCWIDTGFHQRTRNDRSAFAAATLAEADRLIGALERGATPPADTPMVDGAASLRADLWSRIGRVKQSAGASCAAEQVACAEVELVHAGHEYNQGGWRYANAYLRIAEDRIDRAESAAAACPLPAQAAAAPAAPAPVPSAGVGSFASAAPSAIATSPAPAPAPVAARTPRVERIVIATDGLFAFDRGDFAGMAASKARSLDDLVARLRGATIDSIRVVGHTDPLGSDAYNLRLSERRAQTVRDYLVRAGLPAQRLTAEGHGKRSLVAPCEGVTPLATRIACLAPNRRVELEVKATLP